MQHSLKQLFLVGFPNCGKTTLFNTLTGLHQKTGNYSGVTVDIFEGKIQGSGGLLINDLPGLYNIFSKEPEAKISLQALLNTKPETGVVIVLDALQLERQLVLATQILDLKLPCIVVLNKVEWAEAQGITVNTDALSKLLGVSVIKYTRNDSHFTLQCLEVIANIKISNVQFNLNCDSQDYKNRVKAHLQNTEITFETSDKRNRIQTARYITATCETRTTKSKRNSLPDKILLHPVLGFLSFFILMGLIFQFVFWFAAWPMSWIENAFAALSTLIYNLPLHSHWTGFWADGLVNGLCGVIMFIPQIAILFGCMAILEESGYMTRAALLMDRLFRPFGLNGKSMIPYISSTACAVPSILATRTISSWRERLISILTLPLVSCSARLPVYTILIELLFLNQNENNLYKGLVLLGIYAFGFFGVLIMAWVLNRFLPAEPKRTVIMELPYYQWPRWKDVVYAIWRKVRVFITEAGLIILCLSVILWYLGSHGPALDNPANNPVSLESSYLGHAGHAIEPLIKPLGYDWKIGIALISSFAAREVFVGTLSTLYPDANGQGTLTERLAAEKNKTGQMVYTPATCWSLLVFYALALQCMSTLAVVKRETQSWRYPLLQWLTYTLLAYMLSWVTYQVCL